VAPAIERYQWWRDERRRLFLGGQTNSKTLGVTRLAELMYKDKLDEARLLAAEQRRGSSNKGTAGAAAATCWQDVDVACTQMFLRELIQVDESCWEQLGPPFYGPTGFTLTLAVETATEKQAKPAAGGKKVVPAGKDKSAAQAPSKKICIRLDDSEFEELKTRIFGLRDEAYKALVKSVPTVVRQSTEFQNAVRCWHQALDQNTDWDSIGGRDDPHVAKHLRQRGPDWVDRSQELLFPSKGGIGARVEIPLEESGADGAKRAPQRNKQARSMKRPDKPLVLIGFKQGGNETGDPRWDNIMAFGDKDPELTANLNRRLGELTGEEAVFFSSHGGDEGP